MAIYNGFSHWKWWFSIVMLNYQRVSLLVYHSLIIVFSRTLWGLVHTLGLGMDWAVNLGHLGIPRPGTSDIDYAQPKKPIVRERRRSNCIVDLLTQSSSADHAGSWWIATFGGFGVMLKWSIQFGWFEANPHFRKHMFQTQLGLWETINGSYPEVLNMIQLGRNHFLYQQRRRWSQQTVGTSTFVGQWIPFFNFRSRPSILIFIANNGVWVAL